MARKAGAVFYTPNKHREESAQHRPLCLANEHLMFVLFISIYAIDRLANTCVPVGVYV